MAPPLSRGGAVVLENEWAFLRLQYASEGQQERAGMYPWEERLRFEDLFPLHFYEVGRVMGRFEGPRTRNRRRGCFGIGERGCRRFRMRHRNVAEGWTPDPSNVPSSTEATAEQR